MAALQVLLCLCALLQTSLSQENRRPYFDPGEYFGVQVTEGALADTHVVTVSATDLDGDEINFQIADGSEGFRDFKVEQTTGRVLVKSNGTLDREKQARYSVTVNAYDDIDPPRQPRDYVSVTFDVSIGDINDEAPQFLSPVTNLSVGEEINSGEIITYFAEDRDSGAGRYFRFHIDDPTVPFSIGQDSGRLTVSGPLDYDEPPIVYQFPIFATDYGVPALSDNIYVTIYITDFDDLPPKFTMQRYYQTLRENDTIGTLVHSVSAYDQDTQLNYPVEYDLEGVALEDDTALETNLFSINATSGKVITNHSLNYEMVTKYIITVKATEESSNRRSSTAVIELTIADLNDNFPVFDQQKYTMSVTENTRVSESLLTVTAVDSDGDLHNSFEYALIEAEAKEFFYIDPSTGVITLIKDLDFESNEIHTFTVIATETVGMGTNNGTTDVELRVVNENDEAPMFTALSYIAPLPENSVAGATVYVVSSTDRDKPPYNERTYRFAANSNGTDRFEVDATTGEVRVSNDSFPDNPTLDFDGEDNSFLLVLEVTDGMQANTATLLVNLEPVNDNGPMVVGTSQQFANVRENEAGVVVHVLSAQDADTNDAHSTLTWCITGGNEEGKFGLQTSMGDMVTITTISPLDYENRTQYDLTIFVTDGENCSSSPDMGYFSDEINVRVTVLDVNDRPPVFSSDNYTFFIDETQVVGYTVGYVSASDLDSGAILTYSINSDLFAIDNETGVITTGQVIDREMLPSNPVSFMVEVQDRHPSSSVVLSATSMVTVFVNDINDNRPRFSQPDGYSVTFEENALALTFSFSATDADSGVNGKITYDIINGDPSNQFDLKTNDSGEVMLEYVRFLDRENYTHYNLTVRATDNGSPNMSTTVVIYITVMDINDNAPQFTGDFTTNIPEDASPGTVVNTVIATDLDQGSNAELSYFFSVDGNLEPRAEVFRINQISGEIQTTNILDRETQAVYELTVVATDGGTPMRNGTATVTVCVSDINDNAPMFNDRTLALSIPEDFRVRDELSRVSTTDGDNIGVSTAFQCPSEGINSSVVYSLVFESDQNYSHIFEVNQTTGSLLLSSYLDYDTQEVDLYVFTVQATDRNGMESALSSRLTVVISVLAVNDNPPVLSNETYTISIKENTAIGTTNPLLMATDADIGGQDGVVVYRSSITDPVEIDPRSGDLRVRGELDFEGPNKTIMFTAVAYNPGSPDLNDTAIVIVRILDENDEAPVFGSLNYNASINEGNYSTELQFGLQVSANDADSPPNSDISYSLLDDFGNRFRIDSMTGTVYRRGFFDAESDTTQYTLTVVATDSGTPAMSTTATATITIMDVNDEAPDLVQSQYFIELPENDNQTRVLFTVSASDADVNKNNNGRIQFTLMGDTMGAFAINATTGDVTYLGTVSFDKELPIDTYTFEVEVSDFGANPLTSTASVNVTILDENDNKPMFAQAHYGTVSVMENTTPGSVIQVVSADDSDQGVNGQVTYELVTDFGFFAVDSNSGDVTLVRDIDYETQARNYTLRIIAKDGGTPQLSDITTLDVMVTNVLDTPPVFSNAMYAGSLREDASNGDVVLTVNVTGADTSAIPLLMLSGNNSNRFKVDNDGVISTNGEFDYEAGDRVFTFQVVASYSPALADTASVTVMITDVNDHAPVFRVQPRYQAQITAGSAIGITIFSILATDEDSGSNAAITYSFAPNVSSEVRELFSLDSETGIMQIMSTIVYNPSKFMFSFYVVATDMGDPAMSSVTEVSVIVTDDNINAPTFNQTEYIASIRENEFAGTDVLQVFAIDPENNPITYQLTNGSTSSVYFRFDGNTIKTNARLDREAVATHTFTVLAVDNGQPPKMGFALVTITVLDSNDHSPVFESVPITFELTENPLVNQPVGTVEATDQDILENGEIVYSGSSDNFMVDPTSGEIRVVNPSGLDREMNPAFSLLITASDKGTPVMSTSTTATITLRDVNDEVPTFTGTPYAGMILENSPQDNFVVAVTATDPDIGDAIAYTIEGGDDPTDPKFFIDDQGRILTSAATKRLDREEVSQYMLTVVATDLVGQKGTTTVTVSILDINDNPPEFTVGTTHTIHRQETYTEAPVFITTLTATDQDTGSNQEVTYSVTSDPSGLFYFATGTGDLFARCCIDRENPSYQIGDFGIYTIDVMATDGADNQTLRLSGALKLTINVSDYNDNPPTFPVPSYSVSINETSPLNSMVIKVMAMDPDFGTSSVVDYSLTGSNLFRVESTTGVVRVSGNVRFSETGIRSYNLSVLARDRGSPAQFSSVDLRIHVIDENDNAPRFTQTLYLQSVPESSIHGTVVANVSATDSDVNDVITYTLVNTFDKFSIVPENGSLTLIDTLDREVNQSYTVLVVATDSLDPQNPQSATATVQVTVLDVNDNAPVFPQDSYNATVFENSRGGVLVEEVSASDKDAGNNGLIRYSLTGPGAENFVINENTGIVTVSNTAALDRETEDDYVLTVTASDSGVDPMTTTVKITINVLDINDNAPMFTQANYPLSIPEDFYKGFNRTTTFQVSATDRDGDTNLQYSITAGADNLFDIGRSNGSVIVIGELDRETKMKYDLIVTATDSGPVSFRGSATVTVTLTDVNDNAPVFREAVYRASIFEASTDSTQFIVRVSASDADSGDNAVVMYSLTDYTSLFDINSDNGDIFTKREPFDREYRDSYTVTVVAMDTGSPERLTATASVVITVVDINDGTPYFDQLRYIVDVVVPSTGSMPFARLVANDDDTGSNAELEYRLSSNPHDFILSDNTPGLIVANSNLSATLAGVSYTLTLSAVDRGSPRRTGTTTLVVNFLMENDARPLFHNSLFEISVPENELELARRDNAVSLTSASSIQLRSDGFSLNNTRLDAISLPENKWSGTFSVVQREFDREEREFYSLNVIAVSSGGPTDGYAILFVTIMDQNDNSPVFQNDPYLAEVTEGVDVGFDTGIVVMATDRDKDTFGTVSYILTKNENSTFSIDPTSGVLTVSNTVDREANPTFELTVEARDGGGTEVSAPITIIVADINDNAPVFQGPFDTTIPENFRLVDTVVTVVASDADDGINSRLTYSFDPAVSAELPFFIDGSTGVIRTAGELDFDSGETSYDIIVIATDSGMVSQSASTSFQITITDVNDCTPTFELPSYTVSILEDAQMDSVVQSVIASDCDTGENSNITYSITKGNQDQKFRVVNGVIRVNGKLDYEQDQQFILTVVAQDNGMPSLNSSAEVTVFVTDINDNPPEFTDISLPVEISEATSPGSTITTVSATDADSGDNARINFYVSEQRVDGVFAINDPSTGIIILASDQPLDRDQFPPDIPVHYWVVVRAEDLGSPKMTNFYNVTIRLIDINDNPPELINIAATCVPGAPSDASVKEAASEGSFVYQVNATDTDEHLNAVLFYTITGGNTIMRGNKTEEVFSIFPSDGQVTVNTPPDRENELGSINTYMLTIEVADQGNPQLTRTGCLKISVDDINDFPPAFSQESYSGTVTENMITNTILTVIATDSDMAGTPNADITFSWCAGEPDRFSMTGLGDTTIGIGNTEGLDCEEQSRYDLCITAANVAGEPPMAANATIVITCIDINDNRPMFNSSQCQAMLNETSPTQDTVVITLSAYDDDQPGSQNSDLVWLAPAVDNPFHLDATTGVITVQSPLDHETNPQYSLTYTVRDSGLPPMSSTITCTFTIVDENDNPPRFTQTPFTVTVLEGTTSSSLVTVTADDEDDLPMHKNAWFSISGWSPDSGVVGLFNISHSTGEISLNQELDRETANQYTVSLKVTNTERGVCPDGIAKDCVLSTEGTLVVTVSDVNDNPPIFTEKGLYTADLPSSSNPGYNVKQVAAMDADDGLNGQVRYSLQEPASIVRGTFNIDSESGQITLTGSVQQYEGDTLMLVVIAQDRNGEDPYNEARANVSITVVGDIQRIALRFSCNQSYVNSHAPNLRSTLEQLTNLTIPYVVVTGDGEESIVTLFAQDPQTNLLVSFDQLERLLFDNYLTIQATVPPCTLLSIKSDIADAPAPTLPSVTELIPLFALCGVVAAGACVVQILAANQRRATRRQRKKDYLGNIFFGTATDVDGGGGGLMQLEQVGATEEITHENPVFIDPFKKWENVDTSREASHVAESAASLTRGNPVYESQEIRMEMFQEGADSELGGEDDELLAEALRDDSDDEDDILVTAI